MALKLDSAEFARVGKQVSVYRLRMKVFVLGINLDFLTSRCGLLKLFEVVLGTCCETLLIRFGLPAAQDIGKKTSTEIQAR